MTKQQERNEHIENILKNVDDCGRFGRAFELECARIKSTKTKVGEQNQKDVSIKFLIDGKIRYISAECKTNGGRIDGYFNGSVMGKFTIYRLEFTQKLKFENDVRIIPPVVIPNDLFIALLQDTKAIKVINKGGEFDGYGIQVSSKKLYNRLNAYIERYGDMVLFDNEKTFNFNDFINLTI